MVDREKLLCNEKPIREFWRMRLDRLQSILEKNNFEATVVDSASDATQLVMESPVTDKKIIHIGNDGKEIKIVDLAKLILEITDNTPEVIEKSPPEGSVNRRCPDISFLRSLGFCPRVGIKEGLSYTRKWYKKVLQAQE